MAYAVTVADIEARWRVLSDDEAEKAETLLLDAGVVLDARLPLLAAAVTAATVPAALVTQVLVAMVKRVLVNPDQDRSFGIEGITGSSLSSGELYVSAAEAELLGVAISGSGSAGSVRSVALRASSWAPAPSWSVLSTSLGPLL